MLSRSAIHIWHMSQTLSLSPAHQRRLQTCITVNQSSGAMGITRDSGDIVSLGVIARHVQLVPDFGKYADSDLDYNNALDTCKSFRLSSYFNKQVFQTVY